MTAVQTAAKTDRPRVDLSTVTPAPDPIVPPPSDTTTPVDISVMPFTPATLAKWGAWMQARMAQIWPHITERNYLGLVMPHMGQNWSMFIKARKALLLAVVTRETFEPRPIVDIVFCFKHVRSSEEQDADVELLFNRVEKWAASMGAREVRILDDDRCDLPASFSKRETMWGKKGHYLMKAIG